MRVFFILIFLVLTPEVFAQEFKEGQAWSYHTREHEPDSQILIYKIDEFPDGVKVFSIVVSEVGLKNPFSDKRIQTYLPHIPISENALKLSVIEEVDPFVIPKETPEGYEIWKNQLAAGSAGFFDNPIQEILGMIEESLALGEVKF